MSIDNRPVSIRLVCVIDDVCLDKNYGFINVHPVFYNDALVADRAFSDPNAFDPELDGGMYTCLFARPSP